MNADISHKQNVDYGRPHAKGMYEQHRMDPNAQHRNTNNRNISDHANYYRIIYT